MTTVVEQMQKLQQASAEQTAASQALAQEVAGKMGAIDKKADDFVNGTSFVQQYVIGSPESGSESGRNTGNYHLIQLDIIRKSYSYLHHWISLAFFGTNHIASCQYCSLSQNHSSYTGQNALFARKGNGDFKFYIDRTNQSAAVLYLAVKNTSWNSANSRVSISSQLALEVESKGAVNLNDWIADNPSFEEITLIDLVA